MINFEKKTLLYIFEKKKKALKIYLFEEKKILYISKLTYDDIIKQIPAFDDFSLSEIESELVELPEENITIEKNKDIIQLKYKIVILKKEKTLVFDLIPADKYQENQEDKEEYEYSSEEDKNAEIDSLKKIIEKQKKYIETIENEIKEKEITRKQLEAELN